MNGRDKFDNLALATFSLGLLCLALAVTGCGAIKGKDAPKEAAATAAPGTEDRLRTKNDDTLFGRLEGGSFSLTSPLFQKLELPRAEVREIQFDGNTDVVRTKRGDILRGRLGQPTYRFKAKVGVTKDFRRADLKWIELGG